MDQRAATGPRTEPFNGVRTFTATLAREREALGDRITAWLRDNTDKRVVDIAVTQSSDAEFHCLAITVFFWETLQKGEPR